MSLYSFMRKSLRVLMTKLIFPTSVAGENENLPDGPLVVAANHISASDVILLIGCTGRQISFMAKKELFDTPIVGWFLKKMGAFPVKRGMMDVGAVKNGISILKAGGVLGIFPQGTRCPGVHPENTFDKLHAGVMMMAAKTRATILPVAIKTKNYRLRPFRRVQLIYGNPIRYEDYAEWVENKDYMKATETVFRAVCDLHKEG